MYRKAHPSNSSCSFRFVRPKFTIHNCTATSSGIELVQFLARIDFCARSSFYISICRIQILFQHLVSLSVELRCVAFLAPYIVPMTTYYFKSQGGFLCSRMSLHIYIEAELGAHSIACTEEKKNIRKKALVSKVSNHARRISVTCIV